ncbi:MAG: hydroxymethylbilane synthase [Rickettsiales bacterium]|nr:hydroxymethylbilane synthase [Rickettsiales bacterium]
MKLRIGTRKSPLALAQANEVAQKLRQAWPGLECELVHIMTSGDQFVDRSLADIGGKGLFTKEIEEALLARTIDIAVHSMKDMPTQLPDGLLISSMLEREDVRDVLVGHNIGTIADMPQGASFGTSSLRRSAQLLMIRPDLRIVPLRGNVQTRLAKIEQGEMHATMLAAAGLNRLGLKHVPGAPLPIEQFLPAVAQGAIGIECREDDVKTRELLQPLAHQATMQAVEIERAFLRALDGSCRMPIAGYARIETGKAHFKGLVLTADGVKSYADEGAYAIGEAIAAAADLGKSLAARLKN